MSEQNKSRIERQIDASIGMGCPEDEFDMSSDVEDLPPDDGDEMREEAVNNRRAIVQAQETSLTTQVEENDSDYDSDELFARTVLKDIAKSGVSLIKIQEEEMQLDPSARNAETAATLISATTNAVDKLQGIGVSSKKLEIEEKKVGVKQVQNGINAQVGALVSCTFSELIGQLKESDADVGNVNKIRDAEAEVIEEKEVEEEVEE